MRLLRAVQDAAPSCHSENSGAIGRLLSMSPHLLRYVVGGTYQG